MNFKKILASVAAAAVAVTTMAVASVSVAAADSETVKLYSQNTESWTLYESEALEIAADGDYTMTLDAGGENNYITLYIKDVNAAKAPEAFNNVTLTVNSIKVNGKALGLSKNDYEAVGDQGIFDVCFINGWAESFVYGNECPFDDADGGSFSYGEPVNTFEVNFTISGLGSGSDAPAEEAPASDAGAEAPAATGNTPAAAAAVVMVAAGAAALVSKRK